MNRIRFIAVLFISCLFFSASAQEKTDAWLKQLLLSKASPLLAHVLNNPDSFQYQIIYTEINRDKKNQPSFTNHYVNVDPDRYYNPASTVKLPTALIALEKINELKSKGVDIYSSMLTDSSFNGQTAVTTDTSAENKMPSVANYLKKIFLVSDNDAYNRLYEFDGQETLNKRLWEKGYTDTRITRRFVAASEEQNRHTNGIRFVKGDKLVWQQLPATSQIHFDFSKQVLIGKGHFDSNDSLINTPMDFTTHNCFPLENLQQMLQSVLFPGSFPEKRRFNIGKKDRQFLLQYMSELPSESKHPKYDSTEFFDSYCKFFLYKSTRQKPPSNIRIFNKPGWSYGFLTDAAYIIDFDTNTEFMLSAVIYVNRNAILNDNRYEYNEIGYPFFREIGEIIYTYDKNRKRINPADLSAFRFNYKK